MRQAGYRYSSDVFLQDIRRTAAAIGAPFSASTTRSVLDAYRAGFEEGAVLWRSTDRPGDPLNYRFYARRPMDTIATAVRSGFLEPGNPLAGIITACSALYGGTPEQSCDFDAARGLTKTWVYLGGTRPLDDVLTADVFPASMVRHRRRFHEWDLDYVRHIAVDYHKNSVNIYFRAPGPITRERCAEFAGLVGAEPPTSALFAEMRRFLPRHAYTFSVTLSLQDGSWQRVGIYALKLPKGEFPEVGDRLATFFSTAPSYDTQEANAVAWSFGGDGKTYIKAERSCFGDLVSLMQGWNTFFSGDERVDEALASEKP